MNRRHFKARIVPPHKNDIARLKVSLLGGNIILKERSHSQLSENILYEDTAVYGDKEELDADVEHIITETAFASASSIASAIRGIYNSQENSSILDKYTLLCMKYSSTDHRLAESFKQLLIPSTVFQRRRFSINITGVMTLATFKANASLFSDNLVEEAFKGINSITHEDDLGVLGYCKKI